MAGNGRRRRAWPTWAFGLALVLAATEPLARLWLAYGLPEGQAASGFRVLDDAYFTQCLRMFPTGFFSAYASCQSPWGPQAAAYFPLPFHWLYGVVGWIGHTLRLPEFHLLGWVNGIGAFLCLCAAYRLIRVLTPQRCNTAFLVYAIGGGLGGALYILTGALGWHDHPRFEAYFMRFAIHELIEGPHLNPTLLFPRLYYTAPLALGYWALADVVEGLSRPALRVRAGLLLFAATWVNLRVGVPLGVLALTWLALHPAALRKSWGDGLVVLGAMGAGLLFAIALLQINPTATANNFSVIDRTMYLTALMSATVFYWPAVAAGVAGAYRQAPRLIRVGIAAAIGYLAIFIALFFGVLAYYGTGLAFWDYGPPRIISDWALLGGVAGVAGALGGRRSQTDAGAAMHEPWLALWLLGGTAVALSAWGQGWFAELAPLRVMLLLGIPLAVLTAEGLSRIAATRPRLARGELGAIAGAGALSIVVSQLFFLGPLGREPGEGPYAWAHAEVVTAADDRVMAQIPKGRVLAPIQERPPGVADLLTARPGLSVVVGYGTLDHGDQLFVEFRPRVWRFFDPATATAERKAFARAWCADYVYCSDTRPTDPATVAQFDAAPWLEPIAADGRARLYRVALNGK